jgi:hypothetical protein
LPELPESAGALSGFSVAAGAAGWVVGEDWLPAQADSVMANIANATNNDSALFITEPPVPTSGI